VALAISPTRVKVDIAYGGSCTAGKREDFDHYHAVLAWAARAGLRVPTRVRCTCSSARSRCATTARARATSTRSRRSAREILQPACGACANCGPARRRAATRSPSAPSIATFPAVGAGQVWLASPPTVAASAIAGELVSFEELQRRFG
jgi:3-isopropylmalate/(R)-2-methylmalate dehydratase large subunit